MSMKYFFVLGRNPELSRAEVFSYLKKENISLNYSFFRVNGLLVEIEREINLKNVINELGGTIAVGRVLFSGKIRDLLKQIKEKPVYFGRENKVVYSLLNFASDENLSMVLEAMRGNFRNEGLKARYKGVSGTIKLQDGEISRGSPEKIMLRDMNYFLFSDEKRGNFSFGFLEESYDSAEAEKRDMKKPYRRESLAISPRLARILINLSQTKKNEILLDPFCGIGVILGEALLKGINTIGVDIDKSATENARKNMSPEQFELVERLQKHLKIH